MSDEQRCKLWLLKEPALRAERELVDAQNSKHVRTAMLRRYCINGLKLAPVLTTLNIDLNVVIPPLTEVPKPKDRISLMLRWQRNIVNDTLPADLVDIIITDRTLERFNVLRQFLILGYMFEKGLNDYLSLPDIVSTQERTLVTDVEPESQVVPVRSTTHDALVFSRKKVKGLF